MDSDQSTSLTWSQHIILQRDRRSSAITKCHGGVHYLDPGPSSPWYSISLGHCTSCWADNIIPACVCVFSCTGKQMRTEAGNSIKGQSSKVHTAQIVPWHFIHEVHTKFSTTSKLSYSFQSQTWNVFYFQLFENVRHCVCVCIDILVRTCFEKYFIFGEPLSLWGDFSGPSESDFFFLVFF